MRKAQGIVQAYLEAWWIRRLITRVIGRWAENVLGHQVRWQRCGQPYWEASLVFCLCWRFGPCRCNPTHWIGGDKHVNKLISPTYVTMTPDWPAAHLHVMTNPMYVPPVPLGLPHCHIITQPQGNKWEYTHTHWTQFTLLTWLQKESTHAQKIAKQARD